MSLGNEADNVGKENSRGVSVYSLITSALQVDRKALFAYIKENRGAGIALDEELIRVYELKDLDSHGITLSFVSGFSYVASHWYPLINAVATSKVSPENEGFMDSHMEHLFPGGRVTTQQIKDALAIDPSGALWLEQMAQAEFREDNLELIGAHKAITGIRKMYEALTAEK